MQINLLKTSIAGSIILALCCFTPLLVIILSTMGLGILMGYLDYVLIPALLFFIALTIYALTQNQKKCCNKKNEENEL